MWCSFAVNLLVVTLQKNLSSGSHKVPLTENRTVGVIPTSRVWGALYCFCPRAPKTLYSYTTGGWIWQCIPSSRHNFRWF